MSPPRAAPTWGTSRTGTPGSPLGLARERSRATHPSAARRGRSPATPASATAPWATPAPRRPGRPRASRQRGSARRWQVPRPAGRRAPRAGWRRRQTAEVPAGIAHVTAATAGLAGAMRAAWALKPMPLRVATTGSSGWTAPAARPAAPNTANANGTASAGGHAAGRARVARHHRRREHQHRASLLSTAAAYDPQNTAANARDTGPRAAVRRPAPPGRATPGAAPPPPGDHRRHPRQRAPRPPPRPPPRPGARSPRTTPRRRARRPPGGTAKLATRGRASTPAIVPTKISRLPRSPSSRSEPYQQRKLQENVRIVTWGQFVSRRRAAIRALEWTVLRRPRPAPRLAGPPALWLIVPIALCLVAWGYANVLAAAPRCSTGRRERARPRHGHAGRARRDPARPPPRRARRDHRDLSRADRVLGCWCSIAAAAPIRVVALGARAPETPTRRSPRARARRPVTEVRDASDRRLYAYAVPVGSADAEPSRRRGRLAAATSRHRRQPPALHRGPGVARPRASPSSSPRPSLSRSAPPSTGPVARLVGTAERVGAGRLGAVAGEGDDELGRLARLQPHGGLAPRPPRAPSPRRTTPPLALERRLRHAQRLALVGQMAANVAHQVGSPLNVVLGRAPLRPPPGGQQGRDARHLREIVSGAEQISRVIGQLCPARRAGARRAVDVAAVARDTAPPRAQCRAPPRAPPSMPRRLVVLGRRDELEQILLNLCVKRAARGPARRRLPRRDGHAREGGVGSPSTTGAGRPQADRAHLRPTLLHHQGPPGLPSGSRSATGSSDGRAALIRC